MVDRNTSVTDLVGDDKHPFHLEEQQLCACSPSFVPYTASRRPSNGLRYSQRWTSRPFRFLRDGYLISSYPSLKNWTGCSIMGHRYSKAWIGHCSASSSFYRLSSGVVGSKTTSSGSGLQTGQESSRTTFAHTSYIRKYLARFTSAAIMDRLGYTIRNTRDF